MNNFLLSELLDKTSIELSNVAKKSLKKNLSVQEQNEINALLITFSRFILMHYDEAKRIIDLANKHGFEEVIEKFNYKERASS